MSNLSSLGGLVSKSPYGVYGLSKKSAHKPARVAGASSTAMVGATVMGSRTGSAIIGVAEGVLAVSLWSPIGFKEKHPIWGTVFGVMAAFNLVDAALP